MSKKKPTPKIETAYVIDTSSGLEWSWITLKIEDDIVVERQVMDSDIPAIVASKIKARMFRGDI